MQQMNGSKLTTAQKYHFYIFCDDVNERRKKNFFASCIISDCELISAYVESSSASETPFDRRRLELA